MKTTILVLAAILALSTLVSSHEGRTREPLTIQDLQTRPVIGRLGVALGTVVEIRAEVIAGRDLHEKGLDSQYLLKVTEVEGKQLITPVTLEFRSRGASLAADSFELRFLKTGKREGGLTSDEIVQLEKGYVGKRVRVAVHEVGEFSGMPQNLPKDVPPRAAPGFGFSTSLEVLAERQ